MILPYEVLLLLAFFVFALGLSLGSFANVCIYRIPLELSIVFPGSSCPKCKKPIPWYENIPVLSYVFLGGKCAKCKSPISMQYPVIEFLTGTLFLLLFLKYQLSLSFFIFLCLTFVLVVISGIDYYHRIIPDIFPLILLIIGILTGFFNVTLGDNYTGRLVNSLLGILAGGGSLLLVGFAGGIIFKKEAMGGGDVKLMAGIGAIIGWDKVLFAIFIASFLGAVFGLVLIILKKAEKQSYIPFGPFLALASYIMLFTPKPAVMLDVFFIWETGLINKLIGL